MKRNIMKITLFILSLVFASVITAAFARAADDEVSAETARHQELLYFLKHDGGSCHGLRLKGGLGPALLPQPLANKPEAYLVTTILEGRKDTAMPPWKSMLSRQDAQWLAEQLKNGIPEFNSDNIKPDSGSAK